MNRRLGLTRGFGRTDLVLHTCCQRKAEMSPFLRFGPFSFSRRKNLLPSCGVVGERRASVGSRWATRLRNDRSMATRPSALSTGCPHAPKGARRSAGLVHKSTARRPALAAASFRRHARGGGLERSPPGMVRRRLVGRPRPTLVHPHRPPRLRAPQLVRDYPLAQRLHRQPMTVLLHQLLVRECRSEIPVTLPHQIHNLPANSRVDGIVRPLAAMPGHQTRRASLPIAARQPLDLALADTESLRRLAPPRCFSTTSRITAARSASPTLIRPPSFPNSRCLLSSKRGHFRIGQRGHYGFGLTFSTHALDGDHCLQ